ncbi:MAG: hypothetical protein RIS35_2989 [Pseudomonadota bacterium]|jgi:hypothetical protein
MQMIYNSPSYCVVEFNGVTGFNDGAQGDPGGFEIMDKAARREIFLGGALALRFRQKVSELIAGSPTVEEIDEFLSRFDGLMQQPVNVH